MALDDFGRHLLSVPADECGALLWFCPSHDKALADLLIDSARDLGAHGAPDCYRAERQRTAHSLFPHVTEVGKHDKTLILVGETSLVDQNPAVRGAAENRVGDQVKAHWNGLEGAYQPQQQCRRRP